MHSSAVEVPDPTATKDPTRRTHSWCTAQLAREAISALDCALSNGTLVGSCRAPEPTSIQPNADTPDHSPHPWWPRVGPSNAS